MARTEGPSDPGALTHPTIPGLQSSGEGALPWRPTSYSLRATEHLMGTAAAEKMLPFVHRSSQTPLPAVGSERIELSPPPLGPGAGVSEWS